MILDRNQHVPYQFLFLDQEPCPLPCRQEKDGQVNVKITDARFAEVLSSVNQIVQLI